VDKITNVEQMLEELLDKINKLNKRRNMLRNFPRNWHKRKNLVDDLADLKKTLFTNSARISRKQRNFLERHPTVDKNKTFNEFSNLIDPLMTVSQNLGKINIGDETVKRFKPRSWRDPQTVSAHELGQLVNNAKGLATSMMGHIKELYEASIRI